MQILLDSLSTKVDKSADAQPYNPRNVQLEKKLTMQEVEMNLLQFLLAGSDTVSSTLSFCIHALLMFPGEMLKLQQEIDETGFDPDCEASKTYVQRLGL